MWVMGEGELRDLRELSITREVSRCSLWESLSSSLSFSLHLNGKTTVSSSSSLLMAEGCERGAELSVVTKSRCFSAQGSALALIQRTICSAGREVGVWVSRKSEVSFQGSQPSLPSSLDCELQNTYCRDRSITGDTESGQTPSPHCRAPR